MSLFSITLLLLPVQVSGSKYLWWENLTASLPLPWLSSVFFFPIAGLVVNPQGFFFFHVNPSQQNEWYPSGWQYYCNATLTLLAPVCQNNCNTQNAQGGFVLTCSCTAGCCFHGAYFPWLSDYCCFEACLEPAALSPAQRVCTQTSDSTSFRKSCWMSPGMPPHTAYDVMMSVFDAYIWRRFQFQYIFYHFTLTRVMGGVVSIPAAILQEVNYTLEDHLHFRQSSSTLFNM